jgi:hypothetical protein
MSVQNLYYGYLSLTDNYDYIDLSSQSLAKQTEIQLCL